MTFATPLKNNLVRAVNDFTINHSLGVFQIYEGQELTVNNIIGFNEERKNSNGEIIPFVFTFKEFPASVLLEPTVLENFKDCNTIEFPEIAQWFRNHKHNYNNRIKQ